MWQASMQMALDEAALAAQSGDVPVGAVLLDEYGAVLAHNRNRREVNHDPTAHAEILVLREAAERLGGWRLAGCTLVVTLEPCAMCAGAIVLSRIQRLVIGALDPKAGAVESVFQITNDSRLNHQVEVVSGVMADTASEQLKQFFRDRR
jgi:tRNA(adenine34) deaminase